MSNTTDKMPDRYVYLHIDPKWTNLEQDKGITIHVKLDDEGVVVDAWQEDEHLDGCWKLYNDMGVEIKEIKDE